ncbi:MAG: ABC transporter permease, partial [Elusimicrobia bacterium]|nr:ABC transporter permease [Elusimicrobiota bacterium]
RAILKTPNVEAFEKRIQVTGMISSEKESSGVFICGVEPERDLRITTMHSYLSAGRYVSDGAREIFIGDDLAEQLHAGLGSEVVLLATASDGSLGAEKLRVTGLFHSGSESFDAYIVYVPLSVLQGMLVVEGQANNVVLRLKDPLRLEETRAALVEALGKEPVKAVTWEEIDHELVAVRDYQNKVLGIVLLIVFLIVAMGILNTLLMSMFERIREFGLLKAIGARPARIVRLILLESCILGALGSLLGLSGGIALIVYYRRAGLALPIGEAVRYFMPFPAVLYMRFNWPTHLEALAAVFVSCVLAALPPAFRAARLKAADALRHI